MDRTKDDEEYMREMNKMNPDDFPLDIDMEDDFDFTEKLNKQQLKDMGISKKKTKTKVAKKKGKMKMMAKEGIFVEREEFESEKEKKEADMNKKSMGGMMRKGYKDGGMVKGYSKGGTVTSPKQKCRGGGAATRGLGFTIS
jgi:hypothetical protein